MRNDIAADFREYLEGWEAAVRSFRSTHVEEWSKDYRRWIGFFLALQERLQDTNCKKVSNKRGGFMGFWWHWKGNKYLQLEEEKLCFKIETEDKGQRRSEWVAWHRRLMAVGQEIGFDLKRPRFQSGLHMTVAISPQDYRRTDGDDRLDFDATVAFLRNAEQLLERAL